MCTGLNCLYSRRSPLVVPRTRLRIANRAFSVAASTAQNSLPSDIRSASTLSAFKNRLKIHLFTVVLRTLIFNLIRAAYAAQRPCKDFMDILRRPISCRFYYLLLLYLCSTNKTATNNRRCADLHSDEHKRRLQPSA